jgi:hypothetical protein
LVLYCSLAWLSVAAVAFQGPTLPSRVRPTNNALPSPQRHPASFDTTNTNTNPYSNSNIAPLYLLSNTNDNEDAPRSVGKRQLLRTWTQHALTYLRQSVLLLRLRQANSKAGLSPKACAVLVAASFAIALTTNPAPAQASAPVMALPKAEDRDPIIEALGEAKRRATVKTQKELQDFAKKARAIEAESGEAARSKFEREFQQQQERTAVEKQEGLETLKRSLLDQGIDPFTDMEGNRQMILYQDDVDLGEVSGTPFNLEKEWERSSPKRSMLFKKAANRRMIRAMVQDMKNRGVDPLEYFEKHQDQTIAIMDMEAGKAAAFVQQYETNLEQYGQITVPKEGEMSALEKMKQQTSNEPAAAKVAKQEAKQLKAEAKAKAKEEATKAKAEVKAAKLAAKEEAQKAKANAKAAAAAAAVGAAAALGSAATGLQETVAEQAASAVDQLSGSGGETATMIEESASETEESAVADPTSDVSSSATSLVEKIPIVPAAAAFLVAAGGGGYAFKLYRDKAETAEEKRQQQFRMLMGEDSKGNPSSSLAPGSAPALEEIETDLSAWEDDEEAPVAKKAPKKAAAEPVVQVELPVPKKRKLGLKNVFSKKGKNDRETDIAELVGPNSKSPEFAGTLAKILTFGAPGRFPAIVGMPGGMPMKEFELEAAKQVLVDSQAAEGLSLEESAEIFANVVNCMLIDIVDLASTSLKEKDEKVTVNAIKIVVDYMNHAASLYASIAEGVKINPVTYGGDLSKSKLEQMYSSYAVSGMMNMGDMDEDFDNQGKFTLAIQ